MGFELSCPVRARGAKTAGPLDAVTRIGEDRVMSGYAIVSADEVEDVYAGSDVPGEFRPLTPALGGEQLAVTLIRVPPHSDFEQGTGHHHEELEEVYLVTRGTLTMRLGDDVVHVPEGSAVRVSPQTVRSHRNESDEPVEMWAISRRNDHSDATKVDDFWDASPDAAQRRSAG
jgi:mannose-6-phosphate isomerase-like protein (cupin superfamily)